MALVMAAAGRQPPVALPGDSRTHDGEILARGQPPYRDEPRRHELPIRSAEEP